MACVNCHVQFTVDKTTKSYRRHTFKSLIRGSKQQVGDVLIEMDYLQNVTPEAKPGDRSLCLECYGILCKIVRHQELVNKLEDQFKQRENDASYLAHKKRKTANLTPTCTPRKTKVFTIILYIVIVIIDINLGSFY